jgi:hypothetical protein
VDAAFAAEVAAAREQASWRRRIAFDEAQARALIKRLEPADRPLAEVLRDPDMPGYRVFRTWRRGDPWFAEEINRVLAPKAEAKADRLRARYRAFDPAVAERLGLRLWKGETLRAVLRSDKAFPSLAVLARWRREEPQFDRMLRVVFEGWRRKRGREASLCTPALTWTIVAALLQGESLRSVSRQPGMPSQGALYSWVRTRPDFAEAVANACEDREDWFREARMSAVNEREEAALRGRAGRLAARWPGKGRRTQRDV